jgi:hypothetical protein
MPTSTGRTVRPSALHFAAVIFDTRTLFVMLWNALPKPGRPDVPPPDRFKD